MSKRKLIRFYTLERKDWETKEETPALIIKDVINYIDSLPKNKRKVDKEHKFLFLELISKVNSDTYTVVFKSANTMHKPDLIDRQTMEERRSPKKPTEGDGERTHGIIKFTDTDVFLVLEVNGNGIGINSIINYFRRFNRLYHASIKKPMKFSLNHSVMGKDNFLDEIKRLKRVLISEVYVDKSILGSSALNYSNRTQSVQHNVILEVRAEKQLSILNVTEDFFNKLSSKKTKINKIRVRGKSQSNGDVVLDTAFMEKVEHIEVDVNQINGTINTPNILSQLKLIVEEF
jgi:hypothetical protein